MAAMTAGALVLLMLEGKPIRPMAFSLTSQTQLRSVNMVLGTEAGIELGRWKRIEVSYSNSAGLLSERGLIGPLSSQVHFVISDGSVGRDGEIFASRCWIEQRSCLGLPEGGDSARTIRICLIGDRSSRRATTSQHHQLEVLVTSLVKHCQIEPNIDWKTP